MPTRSGGIAIALMLFASPALADGDVSRAKDAYDRGVRAHAAGDFPAAAKAFAEADALAPTAASLEAALEDAIHADDAGLGGELLDRASHRGNVDASLAATIASAKKRFAGRYGKIRADCTSCLVSIDGAAAEHTAFAAVGTHTVVLQQGDERTERLVEVRAGATAHVKSGDTAKPVAADPSAAAPRESSGLSPAWLLVGGGVTAILGGITIGSGIDANNQHAHFVNAGCAPGATGAKSPTCAARASDGSSATTRTNVLLVSTVVAAAATVAVGAFFVRWSASPSSAGVALGARWQ